ncbi:hypothetical protein L7F22_007398 [Adiantum nelumboides]|nr:hypothetical protein [Adiantum nelumboides]
MQPRYLLASCRQGSAPRLLRGGVTNNSNNMQMTAQLAADGLPCKAASDVESADFVSSHLRTARLQSQQLGMAVSLADAAAFPGLDTQGISMARIEFQPRGLNPPHVHPRATPNRGHSLRQGDVFVFPRGLHQFQFNSDETESALAIAAFNSQNPGYSRLISSLFAAQPPLPDEVLQTALGIDDQHDIDGLIASVARALE